jgi:hypothetical protein
MLDLIDYWSGREICFSDRWRMLVKTVAVTLSWYDIWCRCELEDVCIDNLRNHNEISGRFLNRVQVENLQAANLAGIHLFTSSLELAKFSTRTRFKNRPQDSRTLPQLALANSFSYKKQPAPDRICIFLLIFKSCHPIIRGIQSHDRYLQRRRRYH